ncbi:MAG: dethiobiotin synthase [SAR324 cluster bacterium]|nr:dethiobiotin synthase [SAR324 cluster bacterium]
MTTCLYVGGSSKGVGKTFIALGLLRSLSRHHKVSGWKPVDVGHVNYNAADVLTDGERLQQAAQMTEHPNLVNPFLFNEDLPPVLAAQWDGVTPRIKTLQHYFQIICGNFEHTIIEGGRGLYTPLIATETEMDLLTSWQPKVLWVTTIGERELSETLLQVKTLQQHQINVVGIILNNRKNSKHSDLIHYQWLTLEEQLQIKVLALVPFLPSGLDDSDAIYGLLHKHLDKEYLGLLEGTS